jgi:hypothetical protein
LWLVVNRVTVSLIMLRSVVRFHLAPPAKAQVTAGASLGGTCRDDVLSRVIPLAAIVVHLYESGSYLTLWLRLLVDGLGVWFRFLGDSGSGTCFTPALT